jgi:hypothetical protein
VTAPATATGPGADSVKEAVEMLAGAIASLKVAVMAVLVAMPVVEAERKTALTVGGVLSAVAPVVKVKA